MPALLAGLFRQYKYSLREMENCLSSIALYYAQLPKNHLSCGQTISLLAVWRMKLPAIYNRLALNQISYEELVKATNMEKLQSAEYSEFSLKWLTDRLKYLLLSDEQLKDPAIDKDIEYQAQWFGHYMIRSRGDVIPLFCSELSRFNIELTDGAS